MMDLTHGKGKAALAISEQLRKKGYLAYFAGGCVRDTIMRKPSQDFDIATSARPEEVEKLFDKTIPVGKQFGVMIVIQNQIPFEVATFRQEGGYCDGRHPTQINFTSPEEDAKRRDFTVNGLFYDPFEGKVLDFVAGEKDIRAQIIRAIGAPALRFDEDKLRLLRAVRFASTLGFQIEPNTWKELKARVQLIRQVSPERIRDELVKIFTRPGAEHGFTLLSESGLMQEILPEIEAMKGVEQPPQFHPEGDVFVHTRLLLEKLKNPSVTLALGALFHDVGKPPTAAVRKGRITFYEHAPLGAKMTAQIMKRLRFSNAEISDVCSCVDNHMKFADVQRMRSGKLKRFIMRPTFEDEMELHRIDCQSAHGILDNYYFIKKKLGEYAEEDLKPKPLVDGHDLIKLGMPPGPPMKPLLEELYDLQLEKKFKSKEDALKRAHQMIQRSGKGKRRSSIKRSIKARGSKSKNRA